MKILIGSKALAQYIDIGRKPKDIDYFTDAVTEVYDDNKEIEPFYHPKIEDYFGHPTNRTATLDELYTIKMSHIFWDLRNGSWEKHAQDIMKMRQHEVKLIPELYKMLYSVWGEVHGKKKANLSQDANNFFNDKVVRIYVHDSIHASVAYYDAPLYERILMDGEEVKVDKSKFDTMSYEDKLKLAREEIYATALERLVIPSNYKYSPRRAYAWALKRTTTSLARGWFALFIAENLEKLWKPDVDYVQVHKDNSDKLIKLEK
jgi:hypothetical protein